MKKFLALMLALVMVLCLAACGGGSAPAAEEKPAEAAPAEEPAAEEAPAETNDFPGAVLVFNEEKGPGLTMVWTLTLRVDGTFYLEENNPFMGVDEHKGESYTVDGNTVTCTGLDPFPMSEIFTEDSFTATFNEQFFAPEGFELQEPKSDHLSDYETVPGTYSYEDYKADFDFSIYWTLVLKDDGTFTLTEDNMIIGSLDEHAGASYETDGDIVTLHGLDPFPMDDIFKKSDVVIITSEDMTFIPKEAIKDEDAGDASGEASAEPAGLSFSDAKEGGMVITWYLDLKDDGTYTLTENNPFIGASEHEGASYTQDGDTVTLEGLDPFPMSDIFNNETMVVTVNDTHFAPEGYELEVDQIFSFDEERPETGIVLNWKLQLKSDGTFVLTEINPNFADPKVYHGSEYEIDGDTVNCGHMEDGPAMGDWAVETDGFSVTIDTESMTFQPIF